MFFFWKLCYIEIIGLLEKTLSYSLASSKNICKDLQRGSRVLYPEGNWKHPVNSLFSQWSCMYYLVRHWYPAVFLDLRSEDLRIDTCNFTPPFIQLEQGKSKIFWLLMYMKQSGAPHSQGELWLASSWHICCLFSHLNLHTHPVAHTSPSNQPDLCRVAIRVVSLVILLMSVKKGTARS